MLEMNSILHMVPRVHLLLLLLLASLAPNLEDIVVLDLLLL